MKTRFPSRIPSSLSIANPDVELVIVPTTIEGDDSLFDPSLSFFGGGGLHKPPHAHIGIKEHPGRGIGLKNRPDVPVGIKRR